MGRLKSKYFLIMLVLVIIATIATSSFAVLADEKPSSESLSAKLDSQVPLATSIHEGASVSIKYILLYPETQLMPGCSLIRFDIKNESDNTLRWQLPVAGTTDSFVKDVSRENFFLPQPGCGVMGKKGGGFDVNPKDGQYILSSEPGTSGSVFLYFDTIPENVEQVQMTLNGFSFNETKEEWDFCIENIPFNFDIAPIE